jgi:hypothetical protein
MFAVNINSWARISLEMKKQLHGVMIAHTSRYKPKALIDWTLYLAPVTTFYDGQADAYL